MAQLNIAIIHGIGINKPGYSKELTKGIAHSFNIILSKKLNRSDNFAKDLNFIEIVWDDILDPNQEKLAAIFREEFKRRKQKEAANYLLWIAAYLALATVLSLVVKKPWLVAALLFGLFPLLKSVLERLRTNVAAEFINDIISYRERGAKELIHKRIEERLSPILKASSRTPLHVISHSLGTVIASDFVWDRQQSGGQFYNPNLYLSNFFTMGSPLALFSLQFGGPEMFTKPLTIQDPQGQWINIYDNDDPIAYPLKCLNEAYNRTVSQDREVNVGWFGFAHINYWKNGDVQKIIAAKLAEDWLRLNDKGADYGR